MTIKTFGISPYLPTYDSLPTWVGPKGMQIAVAGVGYISDGTKWVGPSSAPAVLYIPLWWSSNALAASSSTGPNSNYLQHGSTFTTTASTLYTLDSKWSASTKFALEATLMAGSGASASCQLYDITSTSLVANTTISTSATTRTTLRSTSVTLVPGHAYGVTGWSNNGSVSMNVTDVSLVAILL